MRARNMTANKFIIFMCMFSCLCYVKCDLNLNEGDSCVTGGLNGTCVNIFKCGSAALTYLLIKAGYEPDNEYIPELPDICSSKYDEPIVCCTDCELSDDTYRNAIIGPSGKLLKKSSSIAWNKCIEYYESLPYPCRGSRLVSLEKFKDKDNKCYYYLYTLLVAVGGRNARRSEFSHVALLGYGDDVETAEWLCGGAVISERFILTAAHCIATKTRVNVSFAALTLLKRSDPKEYWKTYKIKRIVAHPDYKAPVKYHDIALLETETEINFGRDLLPACLDIGNQRKDYAHATGWGSLGYRQDLADHLQVVHLEAYNKTECSSVHKPHRLLKQGYDHEKQMCYGSHKKIMDTCEGDSGGPLQIKMGSCLYTIVGVTSYGIDCGILGSPGMYTRVSHYIPWIESVVWPEETAKRKKKDDE